MNEIKQPEFKEMILTRTLNAPRDLVWKAWTDPNMVSQWWGPHGFTAPLCQLDLRPGGEILIHMKDPDGGINPMNGTYKEIVALEKIVFSSYIAFEMDGKKPAAEIQITILFADKGSQTELQVRALPIKVDPELYPAVEGMEEGWTQTLDKLTAIFA
ncbi:SRPBCC family protein [Leptospira saintgironsiae]|uniref:Activator of Hsp90 ATPase homologue 1/2-like C-terminal domain-containing protein n=1 Tax=Leptospira saintgironsiae TaxID=2023183 RepID=A0A2M9YEI7_9LEPT|nr:SRPBCC domain-containing protein [Leptospira saintgironsiae]PJZ49978.1 hypothetical protein CH362_06580 [Leptospira saintgironsiae]